VVQVRRLHRGHGTVGVFDAERQVEDVDYASVDEVQ
jgi:hypothetical protein